jgi:hypothetical protein
MVVRLVSCSVRECRQALIDRGRETETSQTSKERKLNRTEYVRTDGFAEGGCTLFVVHLVQHDDTLHVVLVSRDEHSIDGRQGDRWCTCIVISNASIVSIDD